MKEECFRSLSARISLICGCRFFPMVLGETPKLLDLPRQRKRPVESEDALANGVEFSDIGMVRERFVDEIRNLLDVLLLEATSGDGRRADADAAGLHWATSIEGNAVFVDGDAGLIESVRGLGAGEVFVA